VEVLTHGLDRRENGSGFEGMVVGRRDRREKIDVPPRPCAFHGTIILNFNINLNTKIFVLYYKI
jgi:hypothetical protein